MKIALIAENIPAAPWSIASTALAICKGLAALGHDLTLIAQSIEDAAAFTPFASTRTFLPFEHGSSDFPLVFERWTMHQLADSLPDVSLSLSRRVAGNVWLPITPSASSWLGDRFENAGLPSASLSLLKHADTFVALTKEKLVSPTNVHNVHRVLAIGPTAAEQARRELAPLGLASRVTPIDYFSMLPTFDASVLQSLRDAAQRSLNIVAGSGTNQRRLVLLISATHFVGPWLDPLFAAITRLNQGVEPGTGPAALVLSRELFPVHEAALRAGCTQHVRIMGATHYIESALAAADVVALAEPAIAGGAHGSVFAAGATGRLAADAYRRGRPILALRSTSGADLAAHRAPDGGRAGQLLDPGANPQATADAWRRAISTAMHAEWFAPACRAAQIRGATLGIENLITTINSALISVVNA